MCVFGWEWAAAQEAVNPHSQKPGQHSLTGCKDRILLPKDGRAGGDLMVVFFFISETVFQHYFTWVSNI